MVFNNNLVNYSEYKIDTSNLIAESNNVQSDIKTDIEQIVTDHTDVVNMQNGSDYPINSNVCVYFGFAGAFWFICFILGIMFVVMNKLEYYTRLPIVILVISFAIISLQNMTLWRMCKNKTVKEGWKPKQCNEMRGLIRDKEHDINNIYWPKYNKLKTQINNNLNNLEKINNELNKTVGSAIQKLISNYSKELSKTINTENAWNSQYTHILSSANQMNNTLNQISKNTKPLQYNQQVNTYNA